MFNIVFVCFYSEARVIDTFIDKSKLAAFVFKKKNKRGNEIKEELKMKDFCLTVGCWPGGDAQRITFSFCMKFACSPSVRGFSPTIWKTCSFRLIVYSWCECDVNECHLNSPLPNPVTLKRISRSGIDCRMMSLSDAVVLSSLSDIQNQCTLSELRREVRALTLFFHSVCADSRPVYVTTAEYLRILWCDCVELLQFS